MVDKGPMHQNNSAATCVRLFTAQDRSVDLAISFSDENFSNAGYRLKGM